MNRSYRVIFNHATGVYQCVSEFAKSKGKTKSVKALSLVVGFVMSGVSFGADYTTDTQLDNQPTLDATNTVKTGVTLTGNRVTLDGTQLVTVNLEPNSTLTVTDELNIAHTGTVTLNANESTVSSDKYLRFGTSGGTGKAVTNKSK